jgi:hypothetical protein
MERTLFLSLLLASGLASNGQLIYVENFEAYAAGSPMASVAPLYWDTWSGAPGGPEDGVVDDSLAHSGSKSLKILQTVAGGGPDDLLLLLGDSTSGNYVLTWYMYIPAGKGGYFNVQHLQDDPGGEYAADFIFQPDGTLDGEVNNSPVTGTYPQGAWFNVALYFDLNSASASLLIDLAPVTSWAFDTQTDGSSGVNQLGSIDFFAYAGSATGTAGEYYVDDLAFSSIAASIGELTEEQLLTYPNPAQNELFVEIPAGTSSPVAELYDASGRRMMVGDRYQAQGDARRLRLDLRNVPEGVYTLRMISGSRVLTRQIVKS